MISRIPPNCAPLRWIAITLLLAVVHAALMPIADSQEVDSKTTEKQKLVPHDKEELSLATLKVDVKPVARDEEIRKRLDSVFEGNRMVHRKGLPGFVAFLGSLATFPHSLTQPARPATIDRELLVEYASEKSVNTRCLQCGSDVTMLGSFRFTSGQLGTFRGLQTTNAARSHRTTMEHDDANSNSNAI